MGTIDQWIAKQLGKKTAVPDKPPRKPRVSERQKATLVEGALKRGFDSVATISAELQMTNKQVSCSLGVLRRNKLAYLSGFVTNSGGGGGRLYLYRPGKAPAHAQNKQPSSSASWNFVTPHLDGFVRKMTADVHNWAYLRSKT